MGDDQILQWQYTASEFNIENNVNAFCVYSLSDGITQEDKTELARRAGSCSLPNDAPLVLNDKDIPNLPSVFQSFPLPSGRIAVARTHYVGTVYSKTDERSGNIFSHALLLPANLQFNPVQFWDFGFKEGLTKEEQSRKPGPLPPIDVADIFPFDFSAEILNRLGFRSNLKEEIISLTNAIRNREAEKKEAEKNDSEVTEKCVFIVDSRENLPCWIAAILLAFPKEFSKDISFTTYSSNSLPYTIALQALEESPSQRTLTVKAHSIVFDFCLSTVPAINRENTLFINKICCDEITFPGKKMHAFHSFLQNNNLVVDISDDSLDTSVLLDDYLTKGIPLTKLDEEYDENSSFLDVLNFVSSQSTQVKNTLLKQILGKSNIFPQIYMLDVLNRFEGDVFANGNELISLIKPYLQKNITAESFVQLLDFCFRQPVCSEAVILLLKERLEFATDNLTLILNKIVPIVRENQMLKKAFAYWFANVFAANSAKLDPAETSKLFKIIGKIKDEYKIIDWFDEIKEELRIDYTKAKPRRTPFLFLYYALLLHSDNLESTVAFPAMSIGEFKRFFFGTLSCAVSQATTKAFHQSLVDFALEKCNGESEELIGHYLNEIGKYSHGLYKIKTNESPGTVGQAFLQYVFTTNNIFSREFIDGNRSYGAGNKLRVCFGGFKNDVEQRTAYTKIKEILGKSLNARIDAKVKSFCQAETLTEKCLRLTGEWAYYFFVTIPYIIFITTPWKLWSIYRENWKALSIIMAILTFIILFIVFFHTIVGALREVPKMLPRWIPTQSTTQGDGKDNLGTDKVKPP